MIHRIHDLVRRLLDAAMNQFGKVICASVLLLETSVMVHAQSSPAFVDITNATVVPYTHSTGPESKAVQMLVEEVEKRSRVRWDVNRKPSLNNPGPEILIGTAAELKDFANIPNVPAIHKAEGYSVSTIRNAARPTIAIVGADSRGVLFGVGRLLRNLRLERDHISIPTDFNIASSPFHPLRGHQLGYRPKTNSYDGWSLPMWEQYIRDLIVFGANSVELIPPRSDDAADSPLFPEPPMRMMEQMSALLDSYGLDVWVWYPAMDPDYSNPATVAAALQEWGDVFRRLPRIDAVFVPGGDPGHTPPDVFMAMLQNQSVVLQRYHPKAKIWVSPQGFTQAWVDQFLNIIRTQKPAWLGGVVFGPQVRTPLPELRKLVPAQYPIRHYPDITHSIQCEYPVENWDLAFALTEGRECINPRPIAESTICRSHQADTIGSITYSEGCNDDVNKALWSALERDPKADVTEVLKEYSRYFIDSRFEQSFAQGLLALEHNWVGPADGHATIMTTLNQFQQIEKASSPQNRTNWRFQQALYRAYYDAYEYQRAVYERTAERSAMFALSRAGKTGWREALASAATVLSIGAAPAEAEPLRVRIQVLAEALFQSIRMQLSVPLYSAISVDRGANLDQVDNRLNDRAWLLKQFEEIRAMPDDATRLKRIGEIVHWTDPGPGGFYDDLGDPRHRPHLVTGMSFDEDPDHLHSVRMGYDVSGSSELTAGGAARGRLHWWRYAETLYDTPLTLKYTGLNTGSKYKVRVVYGPDLPEIKIRLTANDEVEVHPFMAKPNPNRPLEFDLPAATTASGTLTLTFSCEPGRGRNGRGCQVSEVWVVKQ